MNNRDALRCVRDLLREYGHEVYCSWLEEPPTLPFDAATARERSRIDQAELEASDLILVDTNTDSTSGGRESEVGMAVALAKPFWIVGPPHNVYHYRANVICRDWVVALGLLRRD